FEKNGGTLDELSLARIVVIVADVLQFLHQQGVAHHRITARNIFLTAGGEIKLADFIALNPQEKCAGDLDDIRALAQAMAPLVQKLPTISPQFRALYSRMCGVGSAGHYFDLVPLIADAAQLESQSPAARTAPSLLEQDVA